MGNAQFYTNDSIEFLVNRSIIEFDIQKAGLHALYRLGCIDEETYTYWKTRPKLWVVRHIGIHFSSKMADMNRLITSTVDKFLETNNIGKDNVISRKRDAVFIFGTVPTVTNIDGFQFVKKNVYTSFINLNKLEMYYNGDKNVLDIKGIDTRFVNAHPLKEVIRGFLRAIEQVDKKQLKYRDLYRKIHEFRNRYVKLELPSGYYRELTMDNPYILIDSVTGNSVSVDTLNGLDNKRYRLVHSHNFHRFIKPFINMLPAIYRKSQAARF